MVIVPWLRGIAGLKQARGAGLQSCGRRPRRPVRARIRLSPLREERVLEDPRRPEGLPHKLAGRFHACVVISDAISVVVSSDLFELKQSHSAACASSKAPSIWSTRDVAPCSE